MPGCGMCWNGCHWPTKQTIWKRCYLGTVGQSLFTDLLQGGVYGAVTNRMPTSNVTIVPCAMIGYRITCLTQSSRFRASLHAGSGRTTMNGQTWPWVVSRHDRS